MATSYLVLKLLHVLAVVVFVGNIIVTAVWKALADRSRDPNIVAFGQRLVTVTDFTFTGVGSLAVLVTGYLLMQAYAVPFWRILWLQWGLGLFFLSGVIWGVVLIPTQVKQARMARDFSVTGTIPEEYWRMSRRWLVWGIAAAALPMLNLYFMVFKPA